MNKKLSVDHIHKEFNSKNSSLVAIEDISFSLNTGEIVAVVGPSGCGKSTLLNIIAGLDVQDNGSILFDNDNPKISYMLQTDALLPWKSVLDNSILGLRIKKELTCEKVEKIKTLLKEYGLKDFIDKKCSVLSGGMKQRVALIRSLAIEPDILLLDEPFCALDYCTRLSIVSDVHKILKHSNTTTIIITHDIEEALNIADRIIVLSSRPSTIKSEYILPFKDEVSRRKSEKYEKIYNSIWEDLNE